MSKHRRSKQKPQPQIKTQLSDELDCEITTLIDGISKELGRGVSRAQVLRWILESYFDLPTEYEIPRGATVLLGPDKQLADSLDERDNLSTKLCEAREEALANRNNLISQVKEAVEENKGLGIQISILKDERDKYKDNNANCALRLVKMTGQNGLCSLDQAVNIVSKTLKKYATEASEHRNSIQAKDKLIQVICKEFGVEVHERNDITLERCINKIKGYGETNQYYMNIAERNLYTLTEVGKILKYQFPDGAIDTDEKFIDFEKHLFAASRNQMNRIQDLCNMLEAITNAVGISGPNIEKGYVSGYKTKTAIQEIKSLRSRIKTLEDQRNEFEAMCQEEVDISNRLLEKVKMYRDVLRDWLSVVSANRRNRGFFKKLFKIDTKINDEDRQWAAREAEVIKKEVNDALAPPKEDD